MLVYTNYQRVDKINLINIHFLSHHTQPVYFHKEGEGERGEGGREGGREGEGRRGEGKLEDMKKGRGITDTEIEVFTIIAIHCYHPLCGTKKTTDTATP